MQSPSNHLFIRADGNTRMGLGHVMRCFALGQAWRDCGGRVSFASTLKSRLLEGYLAEEGMELLRLDVEPGTEYDAVQTICLARQTKANWLVVDGYQFNSDYQRTIKQAGLRLMWLDDLGKDGPYSADVILNQNVYAREGLYTDREPYTQLLLGTRYAFLRKEFWPCRTWERQIPNVAHKILVTLGGGDPDNVTLQVLHALEKIELKPIEAIVVVGDTNPHWDSLRSTIRKVPLAVQLRKQVTNMAEIMAWADVAVSAGGSTCWELAFMGLPNCIITHADNQIQVAEALGQRGIALNLGWFAETSVARIAEVINALMRDPERRAQLSQRGRALVNGTGAHTVAGRLAEYAARNN